MAIDLTMLLKLLRLILHILECLPAGLDHQPISTSARELIELFLPSEVKGDTLNA